AGVGGAREGGRARGCRARVGGRARTLDARHLRGRSQRGSQAVRRRRAGLAARRTGARPAARPGGRHPPTARPALRGDHPRLLFPRAGGAGGRVIDMKYRLSHPTSYAYASTVDSAQHIAHLRARPVPGQTVSSICIETTPVSALAVQHIGHFGNHLDIYRLDTPHDRFEIEVRAAVEVRFPDPPPADTTPPWEEVRAALNGDGFPRWVE